MNYFSNYTTEVAFNAVKAPKQQKNIQCDMVVASVKALFLNMYPCYKIKHFCFGGATNCVFFLI